MLLHSSSVLAVTAVDCQKHYKNYQDLSKLKVYLTLNTREELVEALVQTESNSEIFKEYVQGRCDPKLTDHIIVATKDLCINYVVALGEEEGIEFTQGGRKLIVKSLIRTSTNYSSCEAELKRYNIKI